VANDAEIDTGEPARVAEKRPTGRVDRIIESFREQTRSRKFGLVTLAVLVIMAIAIVISGPPEEVFEESSVVATPTDIVPGSSVGSDFPLAYDVRSDAQVATIGASSGATRTVAEKLTGPTLVKRPRDIAITPGALVEAVLVTGASNGPVKASLTEPLTVNGEELLERGTVLLGTGQSTEERLFIRFDKAVFRDGTVFAVSADAADASDKVPGIKGSVVGNHALRLAGSMGLNFVSGLSDGLQEKETEGGAVFNKATVRNAALNGASRAALEQSSEMMTSLRNDRPVIEVPEGTPIWILFGREGA